MIEFSINQTSAMELTKNMGGDPAFTFSIQILSNDDNVTHEEVDELLGY